MKTTVCAVLLGTLTVCAARAEEAYTLVNDELGYSYIQINQDIESFSFLSDFKSIGNSGMVGFFLYDKGLSGQALKDYIAQAPADNAQFAKHVNNGLVDLGSLAAGDRVGFYLDRNNGDLIRGWKFATKGGTTYIAFDKNNGKGKDEWMSIGEIRAVMPGSGNGSGSGTTGQPLPGALVMLALGGAGLGAFKLKKSRKTK